MNPTQLPLDLPVRAALGREDFLVSPANMLALQTIDTWPDWPGGKLALVGEAGAGKTHLTHVWAALSGAPIIPAADLSPDPDPPRHIAIEDVDTLADLPSPQKSRQEETLFHLYNALSASGGTLLVTGRNTPSQWAIALPDLASRLQSIPVARIEPPDDALLTALLVKHFADRQLKVKPDLIAFLVPRIERSFAAVERMVDFLDREALARGRKLNTALASELYRDATATKPSDKSGYSVSRKT